MQETSKLRVLAEHLVTFVMTNGDMISKVPSPYYKVYRISRLYKVPHEETNPRHSVLSPVSLHPYPLLL
jgi:hypothetical protein